MFLMKKNAIIFLVSAALALSLISCESTKQEAPAAVQEPTEDDLEYQRSINKIEGSAVSKETFNADKAAIMKKIAELNVIMSKKDYSSWLNYIASDSKKYWSDNYTLAKASEKLPKELKGVKLKNLGDYFNYVFIPSRKGRQIDEIRYNSAESVKAVQVTKTFVFPAESGLTVPQGFKVTARWKIPAAVEGGTETVFTVNLLTTGEPNYTLPEGTALPSGVTIERTGDGTTTTYQWTISGLPIGTEVTFNESGYEIAGYIVTTNVNPTDGKATAAATPRTVAITNEYVAGVTLPSTGGPGTVLYTAAGLSLILGASLWLMLRRRKEQQN